MRHRDILCGDTPKGCGSVEARYHRPVGLPERGWSTRGLRNLFLCIWAARHEISRFSAWAGDHPVCTCGGEFRAYPDRASQNSVGTFGVQLGNSNLGGQTFYLSEDSAVDGFSLFVRYGYVYARGYLAQWDGETLGQVLYESAPAFVYSGNFSTKPTEFRFDFSPISLEAGVEYIAFMRVLGQVNGASFPAARTFLSLAETQIAGRPIRGYAGYGLSATQVDGVHLAEAVWDLSGEMDHALMIRGVSAVPELSPLLMLVGGVMTLGIAMRRRAR